jgi:hypothetical protein
MIQSQTEARGFQLPTHSKQPHRPPKRAARKGEPYVPGAFDRLLAPREHPRPEDISSVTLDLTAAVLIITEHTKNGHHPQYHVRTFPFSLDLVLPTGEQIWIEVRSLGMIEDAGMVGYRTPEDIAAYLSGLRMPADLLAFAPEDEE